VRQHTHPAKSSEQDFRSSEIRGDVAVFEQKRDEVATERVADLCYSDTSCLTGHLTDKNFMQRMLYLNSY